jgi:anthranilate synthase component 2
MTSILLVDNYDSFTFNLVDEFEKRGCTVSVWRNHHTANRLLQEALALPAPRWLVLSPGPGTPSQAGCLLDIIKMAAGKIPIFGVCLGHQAIVEAFGGKVGFAGEIVHGKSSPIDHHGTGLFQDLPTPMSVARYHSLAANIMPDCLETTARMGDMVMALKHRDCPLYGVQFHPESICSPLGGKLIENMLMLKEDESC